jgi:glycosyltransferase involved in cell wall biosynthesis
MVSIIIPCHNSEKFLSECIDSVITQQYSNFELILVNDFSSDKTLEISHAYSKLDNRIKCINTSETQQMGASYARNLGYSISKGNYLIFLDSDDVWMPSSLKKLVDIIEQNNEVGWVIGNVIYFNDYRYNLTSYRNSHYDFPEGIYDKFVLIKRFTQNFHQTPVPGATIVKREIVDKISGWENSFKKNYTDQAFYTKILCEAKTYVTHEPLLLYRQHENSSSSTSQKNGQLKENEKKYFEWLKSYILNYQFFEKQELLISISKIEQEDQSTDVIKSKPGIYYWLKAISKKIYKKTKTLFVISKKSIISVIPKKIYRRLLHQQTRPYSEIYAHDRGTEIARYYIEKFIDENKSIIQGNCLEFQEPTYLLKYSNLPQTKINVIHIDEKNHVASIIADLTKPNNISSNTFDCIICTHVLHLIYDKVKFISELERILKPGGYLILAVPSISMCDQSWGELWRFTELGLFTLLKEVFDKELIKVKGYGNSLVASGEIRGLASEEFTLQELNYFDNRFCVEICALVKKN